MKNYGFYVTTKLPHEYRAAKSWDGESCSFDEFEITERKSQTRHRKLNRLLKD